MNAKKSRLKRSFRISNTAAMCKRDRRIAKWTVVVAIVALVVSIIAIVVSVH